MFVPPVVPGSGDMDPLALHSPRLFWVGEGTLVFSISARLAVIGSLPALVVCPLGGVVTLGKFLYTNCLC